MDISKVSLFPPVSLEQGLICLKPYSLIYKLPSYVEEILEAYINSKNRKIGDKELICGFYSPSEISQGLSNVIQDIRDQVRVGRYVMVFAPYTFLRDIHEKVKESYLHFPKKGDKEYVIEYYLSNKEEDTIGPIFRPFLPIDIKCLQ